jgi:arsenical pump membrane protein
MDRTAENLQAMVPALLFLCAGVPLAALLDRLGFFGAVADEIERRWDTVPIISLWVLAGATTAVLNLDTTVVLLTPLTVRLARRAKVDPLPIAAIPLLLASLASSFLPVSNLTTLIVVERLDVSVLDVVAHLAPASLVACIVGWLAYRRRHPTTLQSGEAGPRDRRALTIGSLLVLGVLVGFVVGPSFGIDAWVVALTADIVLMAVTRTVPWREVPVVVATGAAAVAAFVSLVLPADLLAPILDTGAPAAVGGVVLLGAATANTVNNLPAVLIALDGVHEMTGGMWGWLAGVNVGGALLPIGALANLLWWRIVRDEDVDVSVRRYLAIKVPVVLPALAAAALVMAVSAALIPV